jgi:hypothetical protein
MDEIEGRVQAALRAEQLGQRLADADINEAESLVRATLETIDPRIELAGFGEKPRGIVRELEIDWRLDGAAHSEIVLLPEVPV